MTSATAASSRVGEIVSGRYRIDRLIGEGGMGAVYLAEHMLMRKRVALKLLRPEMVNNQEAVARFEREAVAAAHINHPNVVAATDFGKTDDGVFFLALEYVEGTSLRAILTSPLPADRVIAISRQIALALSRAHDANIVHRDLKPDNVMLIEREGDPNFVKVLDFGIAKVPAAALESKSGEVVEEGAKPEKILTKMGEVLGTPEYMSPEQSMGDPVGPPSDLYALGIVMYEMLTGVHPFDPPNRMMILTMHVLEPVPPMNERNPGVDVPPELELVVRKLLEKQPKDRYAKASDVVRALDEIRLQPSSARIVVAASKAQSAEPKAETVMGDALPSPAAKTAAPSVAQQPAIVTTLITKIERAAKSRPQIVALAGGAVILLFVIATVALASGGGKAAEGADAATSAIPTEVVKPPPPKPARATKQQIEGAARSPEALEELARQFPADGGVVRELALAYNDNGRTSDALRAIKSYFALADKPPSDRELLAVAVRATNGKGDVVDDAFALLEGSFGADGVDALIEILRGRNLVLSRRAGTSLDKPDVRANASKAAGIYLDLRAANSCGDKHELLERVAEEADGRILQSLRNLKQKRGCGFLDLEDCWPCMRNDRALDDAIEAVSKRK